MMQYAECGLALVGFDNVEDASHPFMWPLGGRFLVVCFQVFAVAVCITSHVLPIKLVCF